MNYNNFIFDFDCTIAKLDINWASLKHKVNLLCVSYNISLEQSLNVKIDCLKNTNTDIMAILLQHEQPRGLVKFTPLIKTLCFIDSLDSYSIISNNHSSTVEKVIKKLGIFQKCRKIIGIDMVINSKPNKEGFRLTRPILKGGSVVYIGDRLSDETFAKNSSIHFLNIKNL